MQKIRCTSCDARLKLPESFHGGTVKCPKCGSPFDASSSNGQTVEEVTSIESQPVNVEPELAVPPHPSFEYAAAMPDAAAVTAAARQATRATDKNKTPYFDFAFKRYWTPVIIRVSWFVVLIFAALWIAFLSLALAGNWLGGQQTGLLDSFGMSDLSSVSSLDLDNVMNGKADVDSLNKFLDKVTETGSAGGSKPKRTGWQSFMAFGFTTLSFLTLIASLLLTVLFCRVFFETIVVLFDISKTLKNIEEKSS